MPRITIPSLSGKKKKKKHPAFLPSKPPPPSLLPPKLPVVITHSRRSRSKGSPAHLSARGSSALNDQPLGGQECCLVLFPSPTHLKAGRGGGRAAAGTFFSSRASPCVVCRARRRERLQTRLHHLPALPLSLILTLTLPPSVAHHYWIKLKEEGGEMSTQLPKSPSD